MTNSISAKCGHVKRRLNQGKPLTGKTLEFALSVIPDSDPSNAPGLFKNMAYKLKTGQPLDDYEHHILVDVLLLHARLAGD